MNCGVFVMSSISARPQECGAPIGGSCAKVHGENPAVAIRASRIPLVPRLFRRRTVWLRTVWGTLLLSSIALTGLVLAARAVGGFLFINEPAHGRDGHGARVLVVEGWLDEDSLDDAAAAFRRGGYERIVTSGGPIDSWREESTAKTFAERAAGYLQRHGLADVPVAIAPSPPTEEDRTFLSAVVVRDWIRREGLTPNAIDVFSVGVHSRRSRAVYRLAFGPSVDVGMLAATPRSYDLTHWWRTSHGTKTVLDEALSLAWTTCCFWPPAPGAAGER